MAKRGREVEVGVPGRRSQPPAESSFDQFMNILNAGSGTEAKNYITLRYVADVKQQNFFGLVNAVFDGNMIKVETLKKMFDELTPLPKTAYDGTFLAAPSWPFEVSSDVSITMLGAKDGTLVERHVKTVTVDRTSAQTIPTVVTRLSVGIIYGASGTAKTTDGVLTAESTAAVKAVCARFTPTHFGVELQAIENFADSRKIQRNAAVTKSVLELVAKVVPTQYRSPPSKTKGVITRFVLFFDEMGSYPNFVRGLCAVSQDLRPEICTTFVGGDTEVVILAAGTGVEGTNHAAGSEPSTYVMCNRATNVWTTLTSSWQGTQKKIKEFIDKRASRTASLAADVVQNARAAAAFCTEVQQQCSIDLEMVVTDSFIKSFTRHACTRYKSLNGLSNVKWKVYLKLMCQAIAAQHATALDPSDFDSLVRLYGILTDRAVRLRRGETIPTDFQIVPGTSYMDTDLFAPTNTTRYTMDAAQAAMMLSMFDLGDRAPTGDGFEEAGMDYAVLCALIAHATTVPMWKSGLLVRGATYPPLPAPWCPPFTFAHHMHTIATRLAGPQSVVLKTLPHQVTVTMAAQTVAEHFGWNKVTKAFDNDGMSSGSFWLNASRAHGPDGFCFVGDRVFVMQFKYLTTEAMTEWDVSAELHKMGMRTDECIVAVWLATLQSSKELLPLKKLSLKAAANRFEALRKARGTWTSVASSVYSIGIRKQLLKGAYLATFRQICGDATTLKSFAAAINKATNLGHPAPFLEVFKQHHFTPTFVVMHCGVTPHAVPQTFDGHDVLLVTAPSERSSDSSVLRDYFPIDVTQCGKKYMNVPVPS